MKRLGSLVLMLLLVASLLTACGSARKDTAAPAADGARTGSAQPSEAMPSPGKVADQKAPTAPAPSQNGSVPPASAPIPDTSNRKIILNAQFDLKVDDVDDAIAKVGMAVRGAGGYVQETRQSGTKPQGRVVNMSLRVPSGQYGPITDLIRGAGEVLTQREWTEDVTDQFVDLEARVQSQEIHLKSLQALYERGGSIRDMMELENEIARVTGDIESMKGRLRVLGDRVDFSTIILALHEPQAPMPVQPPKSVLERMQRGFMNSWHGVINFLANLVVFLVSAIPVLFLLTIIGIPAYFVVRWFSKKRGHRPPSA